MKFLRCFAFLFALALCPVLSAQTFVGAIRGLVQDPAGAAIAGANVTLTNEATNVTQTTVSTAAGEYVFAQVPPATYTISAEATGFKKLERKGVIVGLAQQVGMDLKMEIGAVTESVQVTSEAPLLQTATASNGTETTTQEFMDLPNLGRNTFLMSKLDNNVVPSGPPSWNRMQDQTGSSNLSIAGGPIRGNNYIIDGVPITDSTNRAVMIPSQEAVQEMNLQTGTYDATMGRTAGGVFNVVIKGGTNDIHGDAMGYYRPHDATANLFFNNQAGLPNTPENWENWAFNLGGPVVLPKIYNGKNKTFFFVATEGYLDAQPQSQSFIVPTAAEIGGNFSASGKTIYNPMSNVPCGPSSGCPSGATVVRAPFAGNVIPGNMISPVGQAILKEFPASNINQNGVIDTTNFNGQDSLGNHAEQYVYKLEQDVSTWLRLTGSFLYYKSHEPGGNSLESPIGAGGTSYLLDRHVDDTTLNAFVTINPTTVFTARFGFNRFPNVTNYVSEGFNQTTLGFPASYVNAQQYKEFPSIDLAEAGETVGGAGPSNYSYYSRNALFSLSKNIGKQNLTMGFDYRAIRTGGISWGSAEGAFTFNGIFTQQYNVGTASTGGSDIADLLLGYPSSGAINTSSDLYYFVNYYSGYIQDDIRATNKLTINIGLRYEYETGEAEQYGNLLVGFNRGALNPIQADLPTGSGVLAYGAPEIQGQNGNPNACCNALKDHFGPRTGFAYQINDKTVFRGGYGIFYAPTTFSLDTQYSPGLAQTTTYAASADGFATPENSLSNPYPNGILHPAGIQTGVLTQLGGPSYFLDPNRTGGIVQQYSADLQRQLPSNILFEIGYVGTRSSRLQENYTGAGYLPINQVPTQYLSMGSALASKVTNPFYGLPNVGGSLGSGTTTTQAQLLLPFPEYSQVYDATNLASAQYDSLILKVVKRLSKGITFLSTFTWSRNEDNEFSEGGNNYYNNCNGPCTAAPGYPQNVYNLGAEWALAAGTQPFRFTTGFSYELPFGAGKPLLANNRVLNYIVGGWEVNGTGILASGFPLGVFQTNANTLIGTLEQRPNATGVSPIVSGGPESLINSCGAATNPVCFINPAAFSLAPAYTFGNTSRDIPMLGPGLATWDLSLFKTITIKERFGAQFRAEALNAFNTPGFANPIQNFQGVNSSTGKPVGTFGQITQTMAIPRELQLGLHFWF